MSTWRRAHKSDLTVFDFNNPNTIPTLTSASTPSPILGGYVQATLCLAEGLGATPPIPYGSQSESSALTIEQGYKPFRGQLTEGRYLALENKRYCLGYTSSNTLTASRCGANYNSSGHTFYVKEQAQFSQEFTLVAYTDQTVAPTEGTTFSISYTAGSGYSLNDSAGNYVGTLSAGSFQWLIEPFHYNILSDTYDYSQVRFLFLSIPFSFGFCFAQTFVE